MFISRVFAKDDQIVIGSYNDDYFSTLFGGSGSFSDYFFAIFWLLVIVLIIVAIFAFIKTYSNKKSIGVLSSNNYISNNHNVAGHIFKCRACGHEYELEHLAKKCEAWCLKNKSCNLNIIKYGRAPK